MASDTDIKSNSEEQKTEEKAENKTILSACDISINLIFTALHFKALEQANAVNPDIKIQNSAIEGEKESDAKFYGAGLHVIAAIPVKSGSVDETGITKKQALPVLQAYIQWFAGPDIKLNEDSLNAVPDASVTDHKSDEKDNKKKSNESIYVPSFLQYLLLEASEEADEETGEEADEEASSSKKDKEPDDEKPSGEDDEKAKGWYITFKLDIKGLKSHPLADALKKLGKDLLDLLGFEVFGWRSGSGEMHTLGDVLDDLSKVFGKIDPNELQAKYDLNFKKKFPQSGAQSQIWDTKTINLHLKKVLDSKSKSKLKTAELALCTRVDKRDKSYKLYNSQVIADLVTASIQGLYKKFKNKVSKDDVIMVNNYSDDKKNKDDTLYTGDKETGAVADSLVSYANGSLLVEASLHKAMPDEVRKELDSLAKADLEKYKPSSTVGSTDKIIEMLKKAGIDEQKWFTELQNTKAKNCFMVKTVEPISKKKDDVSASMRTSSSLLNLLFEKSLSKDTDVADKVKNLFRKLIDKFKDSANLKELKFDMVDSLVGHVTDKEMKESIAVLKSLLFMKVLYEGIEDNELSLLTEKNHKALDEKKWIAFKKKIKGNLADIRKNKDKILKLSYEDQGQMLAFTKGDEAKNNGYDDFVFALFDDSTSEEDALKKLSKIVHRNNFRNDIVYRFKYVPEDNTDSSEDTIEITFIDKDPNEQKEDKEIAKVKKEEGKALELPEPPKHAGWEFKGWKPDPDKMDKSGETYSEYEEQTNADDDDIEVTYMDIDDPSKQDDEDLYKELKKVVKNPDGSVESPIPSKKEDYVFDKWEPDPDEMSKSGKTFAKYKDTSSGEDEEDTKTLTVYYVVPDENGILDAEQYEIAFYTIDLKNPDDKSKWKQFGEPQTISLPKDLKYPKDVPEEVDGRKFTGWNPTEEEFKSSAIDKYFADDKFTIEGNDGSKTIAIRALYEDAENKLNTARTELDFYIVPMKGLSYNTRKLLKDDK